MLWLVGCSLLTPSRAGPDGRSRYGMLETLRAYGAGLLAEAGEQEEAAAALAGYALRAAGQAAAGLRTITGEVPAELHISVRTVGSHLDRIRDKTGCRRRADLTRLALTAGLV